MPRVQAVIVALLQLLATCSLHAEPVSAREHTDTERQKWIPTASPRCLKILAALVDPDKIDTLKGDRAANTRLRKICHWLADARNNGADAEVTLVLAQQEASYQGTRRAREDKKAILRNLMLLEQLGCLTYDGMAKLRKGQAPTITRGPFTGEIVEVDHVIPRSVAPELDEKLFNLEFIPRSLNRRKSDWIGPRQQALAKRWAAQGLLARAPAVRVLAR